MAVTSPINATPDEGDLRLVGRTAEIQRIQDVVGSSGGTLLFSGEAGAGKTVLLDATAEIAADHGMRVLCAAGVEFEAEVGYAALNQVLLPVVDEFDSISSAGRNALAVALGIGPGPAPERATVAAAVVELLRQPRAGQGLLLIVDDLQWLDRSSAVVLNLVARSLSDSGIAFVGGLRTATASHFDSAGLPEHHLPPLGPSAAKGLVDARYPDLAPRVRQRVIDVAQGNPLALLELPAALSDAQRAAKSTLPEVLPLGHKSQGLFASRVGALPVPTRAFLLMAAFAGTSDSSMLFAESQDGHDPMELLRPAVIAGLVVVDTSAQTFVFRHPLVRSTVVGLSGFDERQRAHLQLADRLRDQPERRAWHLADASLEPDESVAELLDQTARRALQRGDAVGAVNALVRAGDLSPGGAERSRRLAEAAYIGADLAGDLRNVSQLLDDARTADPLFGGSLQTATAAAYLVLHEGGDVDAAHHLVVGALENQGGEWSADDPALTEAVQTLFEICYFSGGRVDLWAPFHAAVAGLGPKAPLPLRLYDTVAADPARATPEALATLDAALADLPEERDAAKVIRIGVSAVIVDRISGSRARMWEVVRDARAGGAVTAGIEAMVYLGLDDFFAGRWTDAQALISEGLALCELHGYPLLSWPLYFVHALLAGGRGDDATVRRVTGDLTRWGGSRGSGTITGYASWAQSLAACGREDFEIAYQHAIAISPAGVLASHTPIALWAAFDVVEAALKTGRSAEAEAHVAAMRAAGVGSLSSRLAVIMEGATAMTAADGAAAALHFERALALPGSIEWPFDAARVRLAYGERLHRVGDTDGAAMQFAAARAAFETFGADPWIRRVARWPGALCKTCGGRSSTATGS